MNIMIQEAARYRAFKERLLALHDDLDEETLADTLEGLTDFNEILAATLRSALADEAMGDALKARIDAMRERLERLRNRARAKRDACAEAMQVSGLKKILTDDLTVSLRAASLRLDVAKEALIPEVYWRRPDPVLDRRALTEALKNGTEIEGAALVEGSPSISVRVR